MFDTYRIQRGPTHVTVEEKRAPTDDSIRLHREYEDRAVARVLDKLVVSGNGLEITLVKWADSPTTAFDVVVLACFKLNGRAHQARIEVEWNALLAGDKADRLRAVADALSQAITAEILPILLQDWRPR